VRATARRLPDLHGYRVLLIEARCGFTSRGGNPDSPSYSPESLLPASILKLSAFPNAVISGLYTFTVGFTRYHCASLLFVPTHQAQHYCYACKARYQTRGWRLSGRDSHPLDYTTLPCRNQDLTPKFYLRTQSS